MRFTALADWLAWQETLHPSAIDLGLERVRAVAQRLGLEQLPGRTITIAGTNGKGSVATLVAALLQACGLGVGLYTSPHLLRYNERIVINGQPVTDAALCRAFAAIDAARGATSLTYFEFGTLAAAYLFAEARLDVQVLEVGLGGRLDAVNLWDADVAVITSVDLDHQQWLGNTREAIGREKAGILRPGRPVVLGEAQPPHSVLAQAQHCGAGPVYRADQDFALEHGQWRWQTRRRELPLSDAGGTRDRVLPVAPLAPNGITACAGMAGRVVTAREQNTATALAVLEVLGLWPQFSDALQQALAQRPVGRLQCLGEQPQWLLDVAHNPQAVAELARWLAAYPVTGPTVAVFGVFADKDLAGILAAIQAHIDVWQVIGLPAARSADPVILQQMLLAHGASVQIVEPEAAFAQVRNSAGMDGRVVVFGSFQTVELGLRYLESK